MFIIRPKELLGQIPSSYRTSWNKLLGHCVQFMVQLFFCLRGNENIDQLKITNIQLVESDDLEYSYFRLVNRLPDKNHKTDIELEGSGEKIYIVL